MLITSHMAVKHSKCAQLNFNFISYRKHDIQHKRENYMEFCDHVYTTSNKIRSLCSFAVFHIGISAPEISSLICVIYLVTISLIIVIPKKPPKT